MRTKIADRFWSKVDIGNMDDCWNWTASVRNKKEGYGAFWYKGRHHPAHRIALFLQSGILGDNASRQTCHKCDNPKCCNPNHLFFGTHIDNNNDKVKKGRQSRGEKVNTAKLTECEVVKIRALKGVKSYKEIANTFNISTAYVGEIMRRESWSHI